MKRVQTLRVGQIVALGIGGVLIIASLVAVLGRAAYVISANQRETIANRSEVERLTLRLELASIRRTEALDNFLASGQVTLLANYQTQQAAYNDTFSRLSHLLNTPQEAAALQDVVAAGSNLEAKAEEVIRLHNQEFAASARFLWNSEGDTAQENLLEAIADLREVQGRTSRGIIDQARRTENLTVLWISIFVPLLLIGGLVAGFLLTRSITQPISRLVETVAQLGNNLNSRVTPSGPEEIAFLGETVNTMAANLSASKQDLQAHKERLERELTLAGRIQSSLLPSILPHIPSLELATYRQTARELGGDFFTFVRMADGRSGIVLGDASGKGAPAAMASALAVGLLEAQAPTHTTPETLLAELNDELHLRFRADRMNIACCCAVFDAASRCLTVANAGCVYPYLRRGDELHEIDVFGMPLGMWPSFSYIAQSRPLQKDDLLLLSSDGLVEAMNERGELFGFERLEAALCRLPPQISAQGAVEQLLTGVTEFAGPTELHDDLTLVMMRVVEPETPLLSAHPTSETPSSTAET